MKARTVVLIALAIQAVTACGSSDSTGEQVTSAASNETGAAVGATLAEPSSPPTTTPITLSTTPTSTGGSELPANVSMLLVDDFVDDANGWGVVDDPDYGTAKFVDGDYVWEFRGSVAHWLPGVLGEQYDAGELEMADVTVRADFTILDGNGVAGVFCRENPDADAEWQWYEFVMRDGYAAIRRTDSEGNIEALAETDDLAAPIGEPISLEATCVNDPNGVAQLTLNVNGAPVIEAAHEDPLNNGVPGLQLWTFPAHEQMDVVWHSFSVAEAERP